MDETSSSCFVHFFFFCPSFLNFQFAQIVLFSICDQDRLYVNEKK